MPTIKQPPATPAAVFCFRCIRGLVRLIGEGARLPEAVATDYGLPLEAVLEAIAYCEWDPPEIHEDWEREQAACDRRAPGKPA